MTDAIRDNNHVPVALGVSSVDNVTPLPFKIDPVTGRVLTDSAGGGGYTNLTQFVDQTPWRLFYSNGSGDVTELALGAASTYLQSNGAALAPTWVAPAGSGTVTSVGFTGGIVSVATPTSTPAFTVAGTSGGVVYFSSASTWASSALLAANSIMIGGGAGVAPLTTTTGTGVLTALGVNVGSAGAFVTFNGALGTPSSGTVTNLTGTASININGTVGATTPTTGVFTTLVANATTSLLLGTSGSAVGNIGFRNATSGTITLAPVAGALGTVTLTLPAITDTLVTLTASQTLTNKTLTSPVIATLASNTLTLGTGTFTTLTFDAGVSDPVITASSGVLTVSTGDFRVTTAGTNTASVATLGGTQTFTNKTLTSPVISTISNTGTLTLPTSTDTLIGRATTDTLTNKRITKRTGTTTSSATPTINTDNVDEYYITAQTVDITSFTTNLSGTPTLGQMLFISVIGTAARAITWGASFANGPVALPTTTVTTTQLSVLFKWDGSVWRCYASGSTV